MAQTMTGTLQGNVIRLDTIEPAAMDESRDRSQRVLVAVEPLDDVELELSPKQQAQLLRAWAEHGPQGPIDDEGGVDDQGNGPRRQDLEGLQELDDRVALVVAQRPPGVDRGLR